MKKAKGITLISLVITIILLIILAGITIGILTGDNGIIEKAKNAKQLTEVSRDKRISQNGCIRGSN